jgi:hypothetical protein
MLATILFVASVQAHGQQAAVKQGLSTAANGSATPVVGSGTAGQITKWTGFSGSSPAIGDSGITEDKSGRIGIGTTSPTSTLTVRGTIETLGGGYKFPDGTVQTTAAVSGLISVLHDTTLTGDGTGGSPLGIRLPLKLNGDVNEPLLEIRNEGPAFSASSERTVGVEGRSTKGNGVFGISLNAEGVVGFGSNKDGVAGFSSLAPGTSGKSLNGPGISGAVAIATACWDRAAMAWGAWYRTVTMPPPCSARTPTTAMASPGPAIRRRYGTSNLNFGVSERVQPARL